MGTPVCELNLGSERGAGHVDEVVTTTLLDGHGVQHLESLLLGQVESLCSNAGVEPVRDVHVGLFEQFPDDEDIGGGTVTSYIVLHG